MNQPGENLDEVLRGDWWTARAWWRVYQASDPERRQALAAAAPEYARAFEEWEQARTAKTMPAFPPWGAK